MPRYRHTFIDGIDHKKFGDKMRQCQIDYYKKNKERVDEIHRFYYHLNKDVVKAMHQRYCRENRNKRIILQSKRRNKERNLLVTLTYDDWQEYLAYFDNKAAYAGLPIIEMSQDHIIPVSRGGHYASRDIVHCENAINKSKCGSDMEEWLRRQPFFSEIRLKRIYKWIGYSPDQNIQQTALF